MCRNGCAMCVSVRIGVALRALTMASQTNQRNEKMKITLDTDDIIDCEVMPIQAVVEKLVDYGAINLDEDERIGEVRLECGCDLEVDIEKNGNINRYETFTTNDIRWEFNEADYCVWAKDEANNDVLLCFGC